VIVLLFTYPVSRSSDAGGPVPEKRKGKEKGPQTTRAYLNSRMT